MGARIRRIRGLVSQVKIRGLVFYTYTGLVLGLYGIFTIQLHYWVGGAALYIDADTGGVQSIVSLLY